MYEPHYRLPFALNLGNLFIPYAILWTSNVCGIKVSFVSASSESFSLGYFAPSDC